MEKIWSWLLSWAVWNPEFYVEVVVNSIFSEKEALLSGCAFRKEVCNALIGWQPVVGFLIGIMITVLLMVFVIFLIAGAIVFWMLETIYLSPLGVTVAAVVVVTARKLGVFKSIRQEMKRRKRIRMLQRRLKLRREINRRLEANMDPEEERFLEKYAGVQKADVVNYAEMVKRLKKTPLPHNSCSCKRRKIKYRKLIKMFFRSVMMARRSARAAKEAARRKEKFRVIAGGKKSYSESITHD